MRRTVTRAMMTGVGALLLTLTACSSSGGSAKGSGGSAATSAAAGSGSATTASSDSTLSDANIAKIISSYAGEDTTFPKTFGRPQKGSLKIGWSAARDANELNARLGVAIQKAVSAMGGSFTALDANGDVPTQVQQIQQLINDNVSAILVWPLDATALNSEFAQAKAKGIPVIAVSVTEDGSSVGDATAQVIYGADENAYLEAKLMSEMLPQGAKVATMKYTVAVPYIVYYVQRLGYWAKQDGLDVVTTASNSGDDVPGGQQAAGPLLQNYPDLKGMLPYNDASALGTASAAQTVGKKLTIFGTNGEDEGIAGIKAGKYLLTIQPPLAAWAKEMVAAAYLAKSGQTVPKTVYPGVGYVITADNVGQAQTLTQRIDAANYGG